MLLSCVAAFVFPFEVFLLSYAILGPLHYLTEISWLHKRNYFTNRKKDYVWLMVFGIILTLIVLSSTYRSAPVFESIYSFLSGVFGSGFVMFSSTLIFIAFCVSLSLVLFKDLFSCILVVVLALVIGIAFQ